MWTNCGQRCHRHARELAERSSDGNFRMAIDRAFTLKGVGLVVTGMVFSGQASLDENLIVSSTGAQVRVRGIRSHNEDSRIARVGERCAINITGRGVSEDAVQRGDWLLHPSLFSTDATNRRGYQGVAVRGQCPEALVTDASPRGCRSSQREGGDQLKAAVLRAGDRGLAQLVLDRDAFVVHGDRFVLRGPNRPKERSQAVGLIDPFSSQTR